MFIAKNNDLIVLAKDTEEELMEALKFIVYTDIEETEVEYELYNGQYLTQEEIADIREADFKEKFFEIPNFGWFRKQPKGYSSAVESLNTAFNAVAIIGSLPANTLIFYQAPDFTDPEQCTEEWLVEHQVFNEAMTSQEFGQFYVTFMMAWNNQEHVNEEPEVEEETPEEPVEETPIEREPEEEPTEETEEEPVEETTEAESTEEETETEDTEEEK